MLPVEPWDVTWTCDEVWTSSPAATGMAALAASQLLWSLSGQQYGQTSVVLRPCRRFLPQLHGHGGAVARVGDPWPTWQGGAAWVNLGCGSCPAGSCACTSLQEAELPAGVTSVTQVKVDGVVVTGAGYRLDVDPAAAGKLLVRLDGLAWPSCQQLALADTQPGTWSVTATFGQPVPALGLLAAGQLACEFLKGLTSSTDDCRVPRDVVSLARQGVNLQFADPATLLREGQTGLALVDQFITAVNPNGRRRRARTVSPDTLGPRRVGV